MIHRIYTEDINRVQVTALCQAEFEAFTLYSGVGFWRGQQEPSLTIEVIGPKDDDIKIRRLALAIKKLNEQDAVLIQTLASDNELV